MGNQQSLNHSNQQNQTVERQLVQMISQRKPQSQPFKRKLRRFWLPMPNHQCSTWANACHANGLQELDPELGVSGTTHQSYNPEHWNKSTYPPGSLPERWDIMAQFLLQGPAQRSGSLQDFHIWASQAQEPKFPQPAKVVDGRVRLPAWVR